MSGFIFGGSYDCFNAFSNGLYQVNLTTGSVQSIQQYPNIAGDRGLIGPAGVYNATYRPAARSRSCLWLTEEFLFSYGGGNAVSDGFSGNDMWAFNLSSRCWAYFSGNVSELSPPAVFPPLVGQYGASYNPGYRQGCGTSENASHLFMVGGRYDVADVWAFSIQGNVWGWIAGSSTAEGHCNDSPRLLPIPGNLACSAGSSSGDIWTFGGGSTSELWHWSPSDVNFTLLGGACSGPGLLGMYGETNPWPMSRIECTLNTFQNGLVMMGGLGLISPFNVALNDLWLFSLVSYSWTLVSNETLSVVAWASTSSALGPVRGAAAFSTESSLLLGMGVNLLQALVRIDFSCSLPGFYTDPVTFNCTACPSGRVKPDAFTATCSDCPIGMSSVAGSTSCFFCPIGTYGYGGIPCTLCPLGAVTFLTGSTSVSFCYCPTNYFGAAYANASCSTCGSVAGVSCPVNSTIPLIASGYARDPTNSALALTCIPSEACSSTEYDLSTTCGPGYTGSICGSCELQYYRQGLYCKSCPVPFLGFSLGIVLVIAAMGVVAAVLYYRKSCALSPLIRIAFTSLQFLGTFPLITSDWPASLRGFLDALSFSNLNIDVLSPECTFVSLTFFGKLVFKVLLPLLAWLVLSVLVTFVGARRANVLFAQQFRVTMGPVALVMVLTFYTLAVQATFQPFQCLLQPNGRYTLYSDPATYCYEGVWLKFVPLYVFAMVMYLLVVPGTLLVLFLRVPKDKSLQTRYEFSLRDYRSGCSWWELVNIVRRALLVATIALVEGQAKYFLAMLFLLSFIILETMVAPYRDVRVSQYSMTWGFVCLLTQIAVGVIFQSSTVSDDQKNGLGVFVIVLIVLTTLFSLSMRAIKRCVSSKRAEFWLDASSMVSITREGLNLKMDIPSALTESKITDIHLSVEYISDSTDRVGTLNQRTHL